jgi:hypothetical protein
LELLEKTGIVTVPGAGELETKDIPKPMDLKLVK